MSDTAVSFKLDIYTIENYLQSMLDNGLKKTGIAHHRTRLKDLLSWLGDDTTVTAQRLMEWRKDIESRGYAKKTLWHYVGSINTFLKRIGYAELCIPKPPRHDLRNQTFGYLTAIEPTGGKSRSDILWLCRCKCGKEVEVPATLLVNMNTTSCGCLKVEKIQHSQRFVDNTSLTASLRDNPISERAASGYTGVRPKMGKWEAYIQYKKKVYLLGTYTKIEDAVRARAKAKALVMEDAERLYEETIDLFGDMPARPPKPVHEKQVVAAKAIATKAKRSDNSSGYTGVKIDHGKWSADITYMKIRYSLGAYDDIERAVEVRKLAEQYVASGDIESLKKISTGCSRLEGKLKC